jgi:O-antigen/teichoic acid export membrane protein
MKNNASGIDKPKRDSLSSTMRMLFYTASSSDFIRKISETFVTRLSIIGIGLITTVVIARILGPEGRGLYSTAAAIGTIGVQLGNMGLHASNTYFVAKNRGLLPTLTSNTLFVSFLLGGISAFGAYILFSLWPTLAPVHGFLLILALAWIPFGLAYLLLQNLLLGIQEVRAYNKIELANQLFAISMTGLIILMGLVRVEIVFSVGLIALITSFFFTLRKLGKHINSFPAPSASLFRENINYGIKAYLAAFFAFLVLRVDLLMVKYMLGAEQAGYYSIAVTMADMICLLPVVIGTILFPKLSAMSSTDDKLNFAKKTAVVVGVILVIIAGIAVLFSGPIVNLLFGEVFAPAVPAFVWLMPGIVFLGIQVVAVQFLNSIGIPKAVVFIWGFSSLLNIALNLKAIPRYGIIGASIVSSLSYFIVFVLILLVIQRTVRKS